MVPAASTTAPQRLVSCCSSAQLPGAEQHHAWDEAGHPQFGWGTVTGRSGVLGTVSILYLPATKNSRWLTHPTFTSLKVSVSRLFTHCCTQFHNTKSLQSVTQHWITSPKLLYWHSWKCTGEITSLSQNPHHSYYHGGRAIFLFYFF